MTQTTTVRGVYAGAVREPWPGRPPSAIAKSPVEGPVAVGLEGLAGDAQADRRVHGGPGKAVHVYPVAHYATWASELGAGPAFLPGGFGENIALEGWVEDDVCIGDVWRMGSALVAVSQGRQPCWKWAAHVGVEDMIARVRDSLRTGWYLRVIEPGAVAAGDTVTLEDRPHGEWTVRRAAAALFDARADRADVVALAGLEALDETWRTVFAKRGAAGAA